MAFLSAERISEHRYKTPEGYLICVDSILARTGKQTYRRSEIFGDDDERLVEVDRKEDEVFSKETLASFENKPICVEHPDVEINAENISQYAVGFVRDVRRGERDGVPVMLGTLVITDAKTIEEIENGEHTDLSCGYDCDIEDTENPQQRRIRGNHVALCEQGRAGIARIVDSVDDEESTYTEVTKNLEKEANKDISWLDSVIKDSKRITDFDITPRNVRVVREFIVNNGNKFSKSKDEDKILDYIKMKTGRNADYGDVMYIIKNYTRAEITDSVKDAEQLYAVEFTEDNMKKYAEDKHGRTFTLEEIEGGKVKATNMSGRKKIFSGWKEAEEEFRKRGIAILDSFYDIVEDSVKDAEQLYAVEFTYDGDSRSDYLGHVNVRAKSEQDALTKAKRWAVNRYDNPGFFKIISTKYTNVETIDVIKDAKTEYVFNYHDTYHGTRDKMRVDANNLDEAIREFGKTMALGGFGTANIYVVSVSPNDGYIRAYGKLSEMLKQKWTRDSAKTLDSKKILSIVKAVKSIK